MIKFFTFDYFVDFLKPYVTHHLSQVLNLNQNWINFISHFHVLLFCLDLFHIFFWLNFDLLAFLDSKFSIHHMNLNYLTLMSFQSQMIFLIFVKPYSNETFDFLQISYFCLLFDYHLLRISFKYFYVCFL